MKKYSPTKSQEGLGVLLVVLIIFVVGVAGVGGWYVFQHNRPKTGDAAQNAKTSVATQDNNEPEDSSDNWNKAELTDFGVSFQYPADWIRPTDADINNATPNTKDNVQVRSPESNGSYFGISLQAGPSNAQQMNLNFLGTGKLGSTIATLDKTGGSEPLYLMAQTVSDQNHITCLSLASTPESADHTTTFGILDHGGKGEKNILMYACLTPVKFLDAPLEYDATDYTNNPYFQTVIDIFKTFRYEQIN